MTKLEERLNKISARICKPIYRDMVSRGQAQQMCKEMARAVLEMPELKALVGSLSKFCEFPPNGEIKRMVSSTNEAIFDIKSVDKARIAMDQWRSFIDEVEK